MEAYDLAERALAEYPDDPRLRWAAVLILACSGATRQVRDRYNREALAGENVSVANC